MGNSGLNQGLELGFQVELATHSSWPAPDWKPSRIGSSVQRELRGTYSWPSEMVTKRAQKGFTGSMPEFLLTQSHQQCLSATTSVKKQNSTEYILKILLALFSDSWVRQHPIWQTEWSSKELHKVRGFIGRREQNKEIIPGKKVGWLLQGSFPYRGWQGLSRRLPN